jgi:FkbM family methyltransferase
MNITRGFTKFYDDLVKKDEYCVDQYGINYFSTVMDFGACKGGFTISMLYRNPKAKFYAIEPDPDNFNIHLYPLLSNYKNCNCLNMAVGDGSDMKFLSKTHSQSKRLGNDGDIIIKTKTFKAIIEENNINVEKKCLLKFDCEGGEKYILNEDNLEILRKIDHISGEIHFDEDKKQPNYFGSEAVKYEYFKNIFLKLEDTHEVKYIKHRLKGHGLYIAKKR